MRLVFADPTAPILQKTLAAGTGYLSQSSKWLHFGLRGDEQIESVFVRWPNGREEKFEGVNAGSRYRITEGADEIQIRRVAGYLFGFMKQHKPKGVS